MDDVGWSWLFVAVFTGSGLFFSATNMALHFFSRVKLQDALKDANLDILVNKKRRKHAIITIVNNWLR